MKFEVFNEIKNLTPSPIKSLNNSNFTFNSSIIKPLVIKPLKLEKPKAKPQKPFTIEEVEELKSSGTVSSNSDNEDSLDLWNFRSSPVKGYPVPNKLPTVTSVNEDQVSKCDSRSGGKFSSNNLSKKESSKVNCPSSNN